MRRKTYFVYIMTNRSKTLYTGVSRDLSHRNWQPKNHVYKGSFTDRYQIDRLVWFEGYADSGKAIAREKQIKGWSRAKKIALIVATNPEWRDLAADWGAQFVPEAKEASTV